MDKFDFSIIENALNSVNNDNTENENNENNLHIEDSNNQNSDENLPNEDDNSSTSNDDSPLSKFAKVLQEEGFFSEEDLNDYDGSIEGLVERTARIAEKIAESKTNNYSPEAKKYVELLNKGLTEDTAKELVSKQIEFNKIDATALETDVEVQKFVMQKYLEKTGLSEDEIQEQIDFFEDNGRLFQKANSFYDKLKEDRKNEEKVAIEKATKDREQMEESNKKTLEDIKKRVFDMNEFLPGMKLNETIKEKIYRKLTTPAKIENGVPVSHVGLKRMKDPVQFEITLNLLDELGVFDGKFDALLNAGKKKSAQELEQSIQTSEFFNKQAPPSSNNKLSEEILQSIGSIPSFKPTTKI